MLHIHYVDGPTSLQDVPVELSRSIEECLVEGYSDDDILDQFKISSDALNDIHNIHENHLRRCCFCGALFEAKHPRKLMCNKSQHFLPCIDCGTLIRVNESYANYLKAGGRRCPSCRGKQIGQTRRNKSQEEKDAIMAKQISTMTERYGAAFSLQVPEMKAHIQATIKQKYGVDNVSQSSDIQAAIRKHSQEKYGVDHYSQAPEIRQRMLQGMVDKYGVKYAQQNKSIQAQTRQTNLERYGVENVFQNGEVRQAFVDNHKAKYGVEWPHQRPDLIEQVKQCNIEKYSAPMYPVSDDFMKTIVSDPNKFDNYKSFVDDPEKFIQSHYIDKPSVGQICKDTGVTDTTIYDRLIAIGRRDLATEFSFTMETEIVNFIHQLDPATAVDLHNRVILQGKEIDIYLPQFKLGIECNPTCTHNSSFKDPWGGPPKHYRYHADKSLLAEREGIFLYHVFGYEWSNRKAAIKSQLQNLLARNEHRYFARNTTVCKIDHKDAATFLNINHRQGSAQASVRLGLVDKASHQLISLMTFGKMRPGIGKKSTQQDNEWELIRFCNLSHTSVVGGASKLFNYFIHNYNPEAIVSFSDVAHTRGNLYQILGFERASISDPGYVWVNLQNDSYYTRVSCQKKYLPSLFSDVTSADLSTHSEREIMMSHNYAQVFDSGVIRWEWKKR